MIMKSAQLTSNIRYVSLSDGDGEFGILLNHINGTLINAVEVYDQDMFKSVFADMAVLSTPAEEVAWWQSVQHWQRSL